MGRKVPIFISPKRMYFTLPHIPPVDFGTVREIVKTVKRLLRYLKGKEWQKSQELTRLGRHNPQLYEFLKWLYGDKIFHTKTHVFPFILYPAPKSMWNDPNSVLVKPVQDDKVSLDPVAEQFGEAYLKKIRDSGADLYDNPGYTMLEFDSKSFQMNCGKGGYFDMMRSCTTLEFEILREFGHTMSKKIPHDKVIMNLRLRHRLHTVDTDPVDKAWHRSASIGISTLLIFKDNKDEYHALLRERSGKVAVYSDLLHVIPSFMFAPEYGKPQEEYDVKFNICREYLEEVFKKGKELEPKDQLNLNFVYEFADIEYLQSLKDAGKAKLFFTGVCIDLLTLRPEILTLLVIDDESWYKNHLGGKGTHNGRPLSRVSINEEFKGISEATFTGKGQIDMLDLGKNLNLNIEDMKPWDYVPGGAAALIRGLEVAREEYAKSKV